MISRRKLSLVHVAKAQLGLDDDAYRGVLQSGGVRSARDLDDEGFAAVMRRFEALGFRSSRKRRALGERRGMASDRQLELIRMLWLEYAGKDQERGLGHWLERRFGVSDLRFLDAPGAHKAINGLRAMIGRRESK